MLFFCSLSLFAESLLNSLVTRIDIRSNLGCAALRARVEAARRRRDLAQFLELLRPCRRESTRLRTSSQTSARRARGRRWEPGPQWQRRRRRPWLSRSPSVRVRHGFRNWTLWRCFLWRPRASVSGWLWASQGRRTGRSFDGRRRRQRAMDLGRGAQVLRRRGALEHRMETFTVPCFINR